MNKFKKVFKFILTSEKGVPLGVATLDALGKVPLSQLPISPLVFKGTWNAATNTPALASGVGTEGDVYIVSVAGNTNLDGISDWEVRDWAVFDGAAWQKVDNTEPVVTAANTYILNGDNGTSSSFSTGAYVDSGFEVVVDMSVVASATGKCLVRVTSVGGGGQLDLRVMKDGVQKGELTGIVATGVVEITLGGLSLATIGAILKIQGRKTGMGNKVFDLATIHHGV